MKKTYIVEIFDCSFSDKNPPRLASATGITVYEIPHIVKSNPQLGKSFVDIIVFTQTDNLTVKTDTFLYVITKE